MFQRILVPLDGSHLAERALPLAARIARATGGNTGFKRWAVGSVARKLVQQSAAPVLLLREGAPMSEKLLTGAVHPLCAVVAVDGSSFAEASLEPVAQFVAALSAPLQGELHLVRVVRLLHEQEYTSRDAELHERAVHEATAYLSALESELRVALTAELDVKITYSVVVSEDVADALIRTAELGEDTGTFQACDLLALATHGCSGLERWMLGSVAGRVLDGTKLPLFIVSPQEQHTRAPLELKEKAAVGRSS